MVITLQMLIIKIEYGVDLPSQHLSVCHSAIFIIFGHLNRAVSLQQHRHKLGPGSDGARAAQSLTPPPRAHVVGGAR